MLTDHRPAAPGPDGRSEHCVVICRQTPRIIRARSRGEAISLAVAAERQGAFDGPDSEWVCVHPHLVFAVPPAESNKELFAALARLHQAVTAMNDPQLIAAQRLRVAQELSRSAMAVMRSEQTGGKDATVIKAAEDVFAVAKLLAAKTPKDAS